MNRSQTAPQGQSLSVSISDRAAGLIAWWTGLNMAGLAVFEWIVGLKYVTLVTALGVVGVLITRTLIQRHQPYWVRVCFTVSTNLIIFFATDTSGTAPGWFLYFLPAMTLPFVLWEPSYKKTIAVFVVVPPLLALANFILGPGVFLPFEEVPHAEVLRVLSFVLAGSMLTFFMAFYVLAARKAYDLLAEQQVSALNSSKMAALGEMAGSIAHEINNPLAVISGYTQQIRRQVSDFPQVAEKIEKQVTKIDAMVLRISKIILGLRSFARDGSHDPMEPVSLSTLIEDTIPLAETKIKSKGVSLSVHLPPNPIMVSIQRIQMSQVLVNLLNNALDAVESLPEKWIRIEATSRGELVEISVTDSGTGIPSAVREKLMQPFFTTKAHGRGTGLGLSISRGIVEKHGGEFFYDVDSSNTRFVIRLALQNVSKAA